MQTLNTRSTSKSKLLFVLKFVKFKEILDIKTFLHNKVENSRGKKDEFVSD